MMPRDHSIGKRSGVETFAAFFSFSDCSAQCSAEAERVGKEMHEDVLAVAWSTIDLTVLSAFPCYYSFPICSRREKTDDGIHTNHPCLLWFKLSLAETNLIRSVVFTKKIYEIPMLW
jgi:hypothetical protein